MKIAKIKCQCDRLVRLGRGYRTLPKMAKVINFEHSPAKTKFK